MAPPQEYLSTTPLSSSPLLTPAVVKRKTEELDRPLALFGFEFDELSSEIVSGHLPVTATCCQPFEVLHGGILAVVAEALASLGAMVAAGVKRVAGTHLTINHLCSANLGDLVLAQAKPLSVTPALQVWEVLLWKTTYSRKQEDSSKVLVSSSKVTVYCNLPTQSNPKDAFDGLFKHAKLQSLLSLQIILNSF